VGKNDVLQLWLRNRNLNLVAFSFYLALLILQQPKSANEDHSAFSRARLLLVASGHRLIF
jgi:hypothetical protein